MDGKNMWGFLSQMRQIIRFQAMGPALRTTPLQDPMPMLRCHSRREGCFYTLFTMLTGFGSRIHEELELPCHGLRVPVLDLCYPWDFFSLVQPTMYGNEDTAHTAILGNEA